MKKSRRNSSKQLKVVESNAPSFLTIEPPTAVQQPEDRGLLTASPPPSVQMIEQPVAAPLVIKEIILPPTIIDMEHSCHAPPVEAIEIVEDPVTATTPQQQQQQQRKQKSKLRRFRHFLGKRFSSCVKPRTHS